MQYSRTQLNILRIILKKINRCFRENIEVFCKRIYCFLNTLDFIAYLQNLITVLEVCFMLKKVSIFTLLLGIFIGLSRHGVSGAETTFRDKSNLEKKVQTDKKTLNLLIVRSFSACFGSLFSCFRYVV